MKIFRLPCRAIWNGSSRGRFKASRIARCRHGGGSRVRSLHRRRRAVCRRRHPTPLTILGGLRLELLSGKGLEPTLLEGIGLKDETVFCHHGVVLRKTPMQTRTVPWLHSVRLPRRGHQRNGHNAAPSVPSRSPVRCVSLSRRKSGNKSNTPPSSTVAATGHAGRC